MGRCFVEECANEGEALIAAPIIGRKDRMRFHVYEIISIAHGAAHHDVEIL
jgi:hypothetical protein